MDHKFFSSQMDTLISIYGIDKFPNAKINAIWEIVKPLSENWLKRIVQKIINECKYSPVPAHFYEHAQIEKARRFSGVPAELNKPHDRGPMSEQTVALLSDWKKRHGLRGEVS